MSPAHHPDDRDRRDEALARIAKHLALAVVPCLLIGGITNALGVPWFVILVFFALVAGSIVFQA